MNYDLSIWIDKHTNIQDVDPDPEALEPDPFIIIFGSSFAYEGRTQIPKLGPDVPN